MIQFILALWKLVQLVVFIITSLPTVIKAIKQLWDMADGWLNRKKLAKACVDEICAPDHLKKHVERKKNSGQGPIR